MKPVVLAPAAEEEMLAAARYYENCQDGLGECFLDEVLQTGERIAEHPEAWSLISGRYAGVFSTVFLLHYFFVLNRS